MKKFVISHERTSLLQLWWLPTLWVGAQVVAANLEQLDE
jgi:hypothetical protein